MKWIIEHCKIIRPDSILDDAIVLVTDAVISYVGPLAGSPVESGDRSIPRIDARGLYLAPGFIDQHVHGGGGADFMDATPEAFDKIRAAHASHGTTGLLATALSGTTEETTAFLETYQTYVLQGAGRPGAALLGIHMEGPYFSQQYAGAQDPAYIRDPNPGEYEAWLDITDEIKRWTIAPERPGAYEMARRLRERGIQIAAGHSAATAKQMLEAVTHGFDQLTHFYSGMSATHYINGVRSGGIVEAGYLSDEIRVELIADGVHLPQELLRLIRKVKPSDTIALITDAMRAAGEDTEESILGSLERGQRVIIEDGVAKLPNRTAMAGSIATMDRAVRTWLKHTDSDLVEAVRLASLNPARFNGMDQKKGSIEIGKDADLILFDSDIEIQMTMVAGVPVYGRRDFANLNRSDF